MSISTLDEYIGASKQMLRWNKTATRTTVASIPFSLFDIAGTPGYWHKFRHDISGDIVYVPCTQTEYESLLGVGGSANNPTFSGHTWIGSSGGTIKVDTLNDQLGDDEYCVIGGNTVVALGGEDSFSQKRQQIKTSDFCVDSLIDEEVWL